LGFWAYKSFFITLNKWSNSGLDNFGLNKRVGFASCDCCTNNAEEPGTKVWWLLRS